jgi:glycosyltransferase involved in cell wall biosynthesis
LNFLRQPDRNEFFGQFIDCRTLAMTMISVVIPAFNRAQLVDRAVSSVLSQSFTDFEVIVVDDGSTEDLRLACPAVSHRQVRYIRQENQGPARARNTGIAAATGQYVSFLDSDDVFLPNNLESLVGQFQHKASTDIVHGWAVTTDDFGRDIQWTRPRLEGHVSSRYLFSNPTPIGTLLIRRQCLDANHLFDARLAMLEDWDFWLRLSLICAFSHVPAVVARIEFGEGRRNTSQIPSVAGDTVRQIYAKLLADPTTSSSLSKKRRLLEANVHVVMGHQYRLYTGDVAAARREFWIAIRLAPEFARAYIGLGESLIGIQLTHWLRIVRSRYFALER